MKSKYAVCLGEFHPDIQPDLNYPEIVFNWLKERKLFVEESHFDWRDPYRNEKIARTKDDATNWHHDCSLRSRYMIVWSTCRPTQFRYASNHQMLSRQPAPYEVWLINNTMIQHRAQAIPDIGPCEERYFFVYRMYEWSVLKDTLTALGMSAPHTKGD